MTIPATNPNHHNHHPRRALLSATAGVALFGAVAFGLRHEDTDRNTPAPVQTADLDHYAAQNALLSEIAEWARANGLSGLSPASLYRPGE